MRFISGLAYAFAALIILGGCAKGLHLRDSVCVKTASQEQNVKAIEEKLKSEMKNKYLRNYLNAHNVANLADDKEIFDKLLKSVRLEASEFYSTGGLSDLCLKARPELREKMQDMLRLKKYSKKKICFTDKTVQLSGLDSAMKEEAAKDALETYGLDTGKIDEDKILTYIKDIKISDPELDLAVSAYCFGYEVSFLPALAALDSGQTISKTPDKPEKKEIPKGAYNLTIPKGKPGDKVDLYGENIVLKKGADGLGLGSDKKDASFNTKMNPGKDFAVSIYIKQHPETKFYKIDNNRLTLPLFTLQIGLEEMEFSAEVTKTGPDLLTAVFFMNKQKSAVQAWQSAENYNEYYIVKRGTELTLTMNGREKGRFKVPKEGLRGLSVPVDKDTVIYTVHANELAK